MGVTFLNNFFIVFACAALVRRYLSSENLTYRLLAFSVFFFSLIVLILMSWGLAGRLYLGNVSLSAAAIFLLSVTMSFPALDGESRRLDSRFSRVAGSHKAGRGNDIILSDNKVIIFVLSLILGFGIVKSAINLVNPPFGWDSLNYHFTFPVEWLKHGNLQNPITINDDLAPSYYPINGSLIYLWFILPLKNVFLADLGQLPFFAFSFVCLYGICRRLNIGREFSFYAAGLFSLTPNYFKQLEISYVDVMVCAWFLAGVYFLVCFYQRAKKQDAVLFGLCLGMLIGTKTIALLYAFWLLLIFIVCSLKNKKGLFPCVGIVAALMLILGGYGYIRNLIDTGNPLYPAKIELFGRELFRGVYDKNNYHTRVSPGDYSWAKLLFHEGVGAGMLVFVLPGAAYFAYAFLRRKVKPGIALILSLPAGLFLLWRYLIPLANTRYLYPAMAAGYIAPFYFLSQSRGVTIAARVLTVICALAEAGEISSRLELVFSFLLAIVLFFVLKILYARIQRFNKPRPIAIGAAGAFLLLFLFNINYNANEFKRYPRMTKYSGLWPQACQAWQWLDENTEGDNIAYVGRPVPFPLYGRNFKNNVFYVSVNKTDPAMVHYFPNSRYVWEKDFLELHRNLEAQGNYREHPDPEVWRDNLRKRQADYLFVYSLHQTKEIVFPSEDQWAKAAPDNFVLSFSNNTIHIYRILR